MKTPSRIFCVRVVIASSWSACSIGGISLAAAERSRGACGRRSRGPFGCRSPAAPPPCRSASTTPWCSITTRSAISATLGSSWVTTSIVISGCAGGRAGSRRYPPRRWGRAPPRARRRAAGSGSSAMARLSEARLRIPPESSEGISVAVSGSPTIVSLDSTIVGSPAPGRAGVLPVGQRDVVAHGHRAEQRAVLEQHADAPQERDPRPPPPGRWGPRRRPATCPATA